MDDGLDRFQEWRPENRYMTWFLVEKHLTVTYNCSLPRLFMRMHEFTTRLAAAAIDRYALCSKSLLRGCLSIEPDRNSRRLALHLTSGIDMMSVYTDRGDNLKLILYRAFPRCN